MEKISVHKLQAMTQEASQQASEQIQKELRRALREAREAGAKSAAPSPTKQTVATGITPRGQTALMLLVAAICLVAGGAIGWMARGL